MSLIALDRAAAAGGIASDTLRAAYRRARAGAGAENEELTALDQAGTDARDGAATGFTRPDPT